LVPKTLFLMPTLPAITGTTGLVSRQASRIARRWLAAIRLGGGGAHPCGADDHPGHRLPFANQSAVCIALRRPDPDFKKVGRMMRNFFFVVAMQGTMQVLTIVIMARFVPGP
jgi:hypothetical protein